MRLKVIIRWQPLALIGIVVLAFILRLYGLNWDQGNNFHPDERQILFVTTSLAWPKSLAQFFNPATSPLNPHFFAYGSFPLYLLAVVGNIYLHLFPAANTFVQMTLVGRVLSALFDTGTVLLTGILALFLVKDDSLGRRLAWGVALLASALVAFTPLELQLSHFYAVDTMLLFFVVLTVLACVAFVNTPRPLVWAIVAGVGYGLALATKFSAAPLAVPLLVAALLHWQRRDLYSALMGLFVSAITTIIVFVVAMPYALLDLQNFKQQVSDQGDLARGLLDLPYVRQFAGTTPFLYEAQNMLLWGLGLFLGLGVCVGVVWYLWRLWKQRGPDTLLWLVPLSWVVVYGAITGSFYVKFMRYMLPLYPFLTLLAATALLSLARYRWRFELHTHKKWLQRLLLAFRFGLIGLVLAGTMFQGLALLNVYRQPNTRIQASSWMYQNVKPGSTLSYEQWDDPLPVAMGSNQPYEYLQASYLNASGQQATGLDLYGDDTTAKAQTLANLLPRVDVLTMATDRLDKSIQRLPFRYPLTIHYYQLLFSGQLGFQLVQTFTNRPSLFGITLDDSNADESYSVFDHPTVRIFKRETPYPYTPEQLLQKLLDGVQLPPGGVQPSGAEHSLLLTPQQITDNQQSPPFGEQFPASSLANQVPVVIWWLVLLVLGLLAFPLLFAPLRRFSDRGYIFSKLLGVLLLSYIVWALSALHVLAFSHLTLVLVLFALVFLGLVLFFVQRAAIFDFVRKHWWLLLIEEVIFTAAFLLFVGVRSLNPDLFNVWRTGEKPMELAFLNALLRSPYMPPLDPWFAGGYINYYYYGYVLFASLIKLTGIVPTTAFNLAIPTLFALTFTGAIAIVYTLTRRITIAFLGGFFVALIGNFNALMQVKGQVQALLAHVTIPPFDFWQSSRIIPFTINEFPYWSFLFADLHPHVIDMPIEVLMLGVIAAFLLKPAVEPGEPPPSRWSQGALYLLAAFTLGTIACVNPWDMPVYTLLLAVALVIQCFQERRHEKLLILVGALFWRVALTALLYGIGYLIYLPFYMNYQQLYVNGLGAVTSGTSVSDYLTIFGLWIFLVIGLFLTDLYNRRLLSLHLRIGGTALPDWFYGVAYIALSIVVLVLLILMGLKVLLFALLAFGLFLFISTLWERPDQTVQAMHDNEMLVSGTADVSALEVALEQKIAPGLQQMLDWVSTRYMYLLLLTGLCISLGMEIVYIRDFLDGGDWERMNSYFKFSMQAWLCFGIGGALAVHYLGRVLKGLEQQIWFVVLTILVVCCSLFLTEGTASRIQDHQLWFDSQPAAANNYIPTIDGFAFARSMYPGDAQAIQWLNDHVAGSPVILEASTPYSYQWYNRVSVYTGLPDVLGWPDHVGEQRYNSQPVNRLTDIGLIYTTTDANQALELLHYYHVRYLYVGDLERSVYAQQSSGGLDKFNRMVGDSLNVVYRANGVTIYEVVR